MVIVFAVGLVMMGGWLLDKSKVARTAPPRATPTTWVCWVDRRYGEMREPADRPPPVRRHYARDFY